MNPYANSSSEDEPRQVEKTQHTPQSCEWKTKSLSISITVRGPDPPHTGQTQGLSTQKAERWARARVRLEHV